MHTYAFDPKFDIEEFCEENSDLLEEDQILRQLCVIASQRMQWPNYQQALLQIAEAELAIADFQQQVQIAGGVDAWRASIISDAPSEIAGRNLVTLQEGRAQQHFDKYDTARAVIEELQETLYHRARSLRNDKARAKWIEENPEAHAKEREVWAREAELRQKALELK